MSRFTTWMKLGWLPLVAAMLLPGCEPGGGATLEVPGDCADCQPVPGPDPGTDRPLTAFLSTNRPRLIRDSLDEGRTDLTVEVSRNANFEWRVESINGASVENLLELCFPVPGGDCIDVGSLGGEAPGEGLESVLRVLGVSRDPGPTGTTVRIRVIITPTGGGDPIEETLLLTLVRPAGELAVAIDAESGRVRPLREVGLRAIVTGGTPFVTDGAALNRCTTADGETMYNPPDEDPLYCITWSVDEAGLGLGTEPGDRVGTSALETGENGESLSDVTYEAPLGVGNVTFRVDVTDRRGNRATSTVNIAVASDPALSIAEASSNPEASGTNLAPGDNSMLRVRAAGGEPPYEVTFTKSGGNVSGGVLASNSCNIAMSGAGGCNVTYTAPANDVGTELIDVVVTDAVGAEESTTISIPISSPQALSVSVAGDAAGVPPGSAIDVESSVSGGTPPYQICYALVNSGGGLTGTLSGGMNCPAGTELVIAGTTYSNCTCGFGDVASKGLDVANEGRNYSAPGVASNVSILVAVQDAVGARATSTLPVTVSSNAVGGNPLTSPSLIADDSSLCLGQSTTLTAGASGGTLPYTFTFEVVGALLSGESLIPNGSTPNPTAVYTAPDNFGGTRNVRVRIDEPGGSSTTAIIGISVGLEPMTNAGTDQEVCQNASPIMMGGNPTAQGGTPPFSFTWTGTGSGFLSSTTTANPTFNPGLAGPGMHEVCVTATDHENCQSIDDCATITVNALPVATAANNGPVCAGMDVNLMGGPPGMASYSWTGPMSYSANTQNAVVSPAVSGTYTLNIVDPNGCADSDSTIVAVNANPSAQITTPSQVCANQMGVAASVPNAGMGATYDWTVTGGTLASGDGTNAITYDVGVGPVTLDVTVTNGNGCVSMGSTMVTPDANPSATIMGGSSVCLNSTGNSVSVPVAAGPASYNWSITGGNITAGQGSAQINYTATAAAGVDVITINITVNEGGCISMGTFLVDVVDPASCDDSEICTTDSCINGACVNMNNTIPCNDGLFCTQNDVCGGGTCGGTPTACDDSIACTMDDCDEMNDTCTNDLDAGSCLIAGECFMDGESNPMNDCEECNVAMNTTAWSPKSAGSACGDGDDNDCTDPDTCDGAGTCESNDETDGTMCTDDGNQCTTNTCMNGMCTATMLPPGTACGDPSNTDCTDPDLCNNMGVCQPNHENEGGACTSCANPPCDTCDMGVCQDAP